MREKNSHNTSSLEFSALNNTNDTNPYLRLLSCGFTNDKDVHSLKSNRLNEHLFICCTEGTFDCIITNKTFTLSKGDIILAKVGSSINIENNPSVPLSIAWITFNGLISTGILRYSCLLKSFPICKVNDIDFFVNLINKMLLTHRHGSVHHILRDCYLLDFLMHIAKAQYKKYYSTAQNNAKIYVTEALKYITIHYNDNISINELASYIGIDRSHLTYCFTQSIGISPKKIITLYKMFISAQELVETSKPIKIIAVEVGYHDPISFSKAFKLFHNVSPSEFRKNIAK